MPELPEVETVKRTLKPKLIGKTIKKVDVLYSNIIAYPKIEEFIKQIENQSIIDIKRRGKWLIFELDNYYLLSHLRMEGKYHFKKLDDKMEKHEHVNFILNDDICLRYNDTRKFGKMYLYTKEEAFNNKPLNELGLEPWDDNLTTDYLKEKYNNKTIPIKTVLLDQCIITGIGNIYADEILFLSNINPLKKAKDLNKKELNNIINNTKLILEKAIDDGGTTIRSYESSEGVHGRFQQNLHVHNQLGKKCNVCGNEIIKIQVNGRGTYYCPKCQK